MLHHKRTSPPLDVFVTVFLIGEMRILSLRRSAVIVVNVPDERILDLGCSLSSRRPRKLISTAVALPARRTPRCSFPAARSCGSACRFRQWQPPKKCADTITTGTLTATRSSIAVSKKSACCHRNNRSRQCASNPRPVMSPENRSPAHCSRFAA